MNSLSTCSLYLLTTSSSLGMISEAFSYSRFKANNPFFMVSFARYSSDLASFVNAFFRMKLQFSFSSFLRILSVNYAFLK